MLRISTPVSSKVSSDLRSTSFAPSRHAARSSEYRSASGSASARAGRSARRVGHHAVVEPRCQGLRREAGVAGRGRRLDATFELGARRAAVPVVGRLLARHPRPHRAVRREFGGRVGDRRRTPSGPSRSGRGRRVAPRAPGHGSDARSSHTENSDVRRRCQLLSKTITSWFRASWTVGFESRSFFVPETGARPRATARGAGIEHRSEARGGARRVLDEDQFGRALSRERANLSSVNALRPCSPCSPLRQSPVQETWQLGLGAHHLSPARHSRRHSSRPSSLILPLAQFADYLAHLRAGLLEEGRDLLLSVRRRSRLWDRES